MDPLLLTAVALDPPGRYADFPLAQLDDSSSSDELPLHAVWQLMDGLVTCDPPLQDLASDWAVIATGWAALGVTLRRVSLRTLADDVRGKAKSMDELKAIAPAEDWLPEFLNSVGIAWSKRRGHDPNNLKGLLPNQTGALCDPDKLWRDAGIPPELKDLAEDLNIEARSTLLGHEIAKSAEDPRWPQLGLMLEKAVQRIRNTEDLIAHCTRKLEGLSNAKLPDIPGEARAKVTARFLSFLWRQNADLALVAQRVPLLTSSGGWHRVDPGKRMMLPLL